MISKYFGYTLLGIAVTIGYNTFLIQRDVELFKSHEQNVQQVK
jgi:hypothetical protein